MTSYVVLLLLFLQEELDVRKDTERAEEIRAMKKAWEDAQPGRAAKALQSRLQFLSTHVVKVPGSEDDVTQQQPPTGSREDAVITAPSEANVTDRTLSPAPPAAPGAPNDVMDADSILSNVPPPLPTSKEVVPPINLTPWIK